MEPRRKSLLLLAAVVCAAVLSSMAAYEFSPDWTVEMPLPYSWKIAQAFLDAHNERRAVPPQIAADMRKLTWNATLALQAKRLVRKCSTQLDTLNNTVGQTIFAGGSHELNVDKANETLFAWVERDLVTHPMDEEGRMQLHFASQVLWAETSSVGCASHWCPNQIKNAGKIVGVLTACNYYPPGNYPDRKIFKIGQPCTRCSDEFLYCDNTLCTPERPTYASRYQPIDPSIP